MPFLSGMHWPELLVLLLIVLLVFGASKLPQIGSGMGKAIKEFKHEMSEVTDGGKDAAKLAPPASGGEAE